MKRRGSTIRSVSKRARNGLTKSELQDIQDARNSTVTDPTELLFAAQPDFSPEQFADTPLPAELAVERDVLLAATVALWERWKALGRAIATAGRPTIIQ